MSDELSVAGLRLLLHPCAAAPIQVEVTDTRRSLAAGEAYEFPIAAPVRGAQP